jgi:hypothetical protein
MRWLNRRQPEPPTNVRLEFDNGDVVPLECVYVGRQKGLHHWEAVYHVDASGHDAARLLFDTLPGYTSIGVTVVHEE